MGKHLRCDGVWSTCAIGKLRDITSSDSLSSERCMLLYVCMNDWMKGWELCLQVCVALSSLQEKRQHMQLACEISCRAMHSLHSKSFRLKFCSCLAFFTREESQTAVPCSSVPKFVEVAHGLSSGSQVELREAFEFEQTGAHILSFFSLFSCRTGSSHRDLFYMHEDILLAASSPDKLDVECGVISTQETHSVYCLWVEAYSFFSFRISTMSCHGPGHSHILLILDWKGIDMRWYLRLKRPLVNYPSPSSESPWSLLSRLYIITSSLAVQADASLHTI